MRIELTDTHYAHVEDFEYNSALESVLVWMLKDIHQMSYYKGWGGQQGAICGRDVPTTVKLLYELYNYVSFNKAVFIKHASVFKPIKGHYQWDNYTPESIYEPALEYLSKLIAGLSKVGKKYHHYRVEVS
jgi:hypothetical protein